MNIKQPSILLACLALILFQELARNNRSPGMAAAPAAGFTEINASLPGVTHGSVIWGDYNVDGNLDLLLTGQSATGRIATIYRNDGPGAGSTWVFTPITAGLTGVTNSSAAWGDFNNDGLLDLLLTGLADGSIPITKLYRNDGPGGGNSWNFTEVVTGLPGVQSGSVAWGDYNNDGRSDILLAGYADSFQADRVTKVFRNDGPGSGSGWVFTDIFGENNNLVPGGVAAVSVAWGDYDNEGKPDILLAGLAGDPPLNGPIARVYRNAGSDVFVDIANGLTGGENSTVAWGDFNNDEKLDFILAGDDGLGTASSIVYRNDAPVPNTLPVAPSNIRTVVKGTSVTLLWDSASDNQTLASGLTYNLRVGSAPGGQDVMAPLVGGSGYRLVTQIGNVQHGLTANLRGLAPNTTYYWSVQAVDSAFSGGPFASEGNFTTQEEHSIFLPLLR